ncbi:hypothetical protein ABZ705_34480, partial [Streptomyces sp. NPDC006984]
DPQVPCSSASGARQHDQPAQDGAIRANAGALGAYAWQLEEQERIDKEASVDKSENFGSRQMYLKALAAEWAKVNPDHELSTEPYISREIIGNSAFNGNETANRIAG